MTDPIADMLTSSGTPSRPHARVDVPTSRLKAEIARILEREGTSRFQDVEDAPRPIARDSHLAHVGPTRGNQVNCGHQPRQPPRTPCLFRP